MHAAASTAWAARACGRSVHERMTQHAHMQLYAPAPAAQPVMADVMAALICACRKSRQTRRCCSINNKNLSLFPTCLHDVGGDAASGGRQLRGNPPCSADRSAPRVQQHVQVAGPAVQHLVLLGVKRRNRRLVADQLLHYRGGGHQGVVLCSQGGRTAIRCPGGPAPRLLARS